MDACQANNPEKISLGSLLQGAGLDLGLEANATH